MEKFLKQCKTWVLASALAFPLVSLAISGDIYEIRPISGSCTAEEAMKPGEKATFVIRTLSRNYRLEDRTDDYPDPLDWDIYFIGQGSEKLADLQNPLMVGIVVSGRLKFARITSITRIAGSGYECYNDINCEYIAEAGDLAMPILLAMEGSDWRTGAAVAADVADDTDVKYFLMNADRWAIKNKRGDVLDLRYCADSTAVHGAGFSPAQSGSPVRDYTLAECSFYVKTIDFDDTWEREDNGIWRTVHENTTMTTFEPTITTMSVPSNSVTLYVWSEDETSVKMAEGKAVSMKNPKAGEEGEPDTITRTVYEFKTVAGVSTYPIKIRGVKRDTETNLILSPTKGYYFNGAGTLLVNYITRHVACDEEPQPFMTVTDANDQQSITIDATAEYTKATPMKLTFSKAFTNDVTVCLNPTVGSTDIKPLEGKYISILQNENDPSTVTPTNCVVMKKGETTCIFYLYALGTCNEIRSTGITLKPTAIEADAVDFFKDGLANQRNALVRITNMSPIISEVTAPASGFAQDQIDVAVTVADNWRDLDTINSNGYKVAITLGGQKVLETNNIHFAELVSVSFNVTIPAEGNPLKGVVQVWDPMGASTTGTFELEAKAPLTIIPRFFASSANDAEPDSRSEYAEGEASYLRFVLSADAPSDMYAFLVPLDAASSNMFNTTAITNGLYIETGSANPDRSEARRVQFLDGDQLGGSVDQHKTMGRFTVIVKDKPDFNDSTANILTTFSPKTWAVSVTNLPPRVEMAYKWGGEATNSSKIVNFGTLSATVPAQNQITFAVKVTDPSLKDLKDMTNPIQVRWIWTEGPTGEQEEQDPEFSNVDENGYATMDITFYEEGVVQEVKVYACDRDMRAADDYGDLGDPLWTFYVKVGSQPTINIIYPQKDPETGEYIKTFYENKKGSVGGNYITIKLSDYPATTDHAKGEKPVGTKENPLRVEVTIDEEYWPEDGGRLKLSTNIVEFTSKNDNTKGKQITFDWNDQNGGSDLPSTFFIHARVLNDDTHNKYDTSWSEYFVESDDEIRMMNVEPTLKVEMVSEGKTFSVSNNWTVGERIRLRWTASDIACDLTNGNFIVAWNGVNSISQGAFYKIKPTDPLSVTNVLQGSVSGEMEFLVPSAEYTEVTFTAMDPEGGESTPSTEAKYRTRFWIHVVPTKELMINLLGPAISGKSKYANAAGLGRGIVYGLSSDTQSAIQFSESFYYNESAKDAKVVAIGYPAAPSNSLDNGHVYAKYDTIPLDIYGDKYDENKKKEDPTYNYYDYQGEKDNFFYCWVKIADNQGTTLLPRPAQCTGVWTQPEVIALDNEKSAGGGYATTLLEAIFAEEYLVSDEMGDINADGIPDLYVDRYGFGAEGDDAAAIASSDLKDKSKYNDDEDYLPFGEIGYWGNLIPGLPENWAITSQKFTAKLEIRGYGDCLNDAPKTARIANAKLCRIYGNPGWGNLVEMEDLPADYCPSSTLTRVEWMAYVKAGMPGVDQWSPERPTDPTVADTDEDGFPDGYEYYFWYRAHVGYLEGTNHVYLTGESYNPERPGHGDLITSETIERVMDPLVANAADAERDTDNDGLPDLLEIAMGTHPFHWDTDGDGLPDGYEVMIGTDPCIGFDALSNTDMDYMACTTFNGDEEAAPVYAFISKDGKQVEYYSMLTNAEVAVDLAAEPLAGQLFTVTTVDEEGNEHTSTNLMLRAPKIVLINDGSEEPHYVLTETLLETECWRAEWTEDGVLCRGLPISVPRGTLVDGPSDSCEIYRRQLVMPLLTVPVYRVWQYGPRGYADAEGMAPYGNWVCGEEVIPGSLKGRELLSAFVGGVFLIHTHVYQERPFHPDTGWGGGANEVAYCLIDEFLVMTWHYNDNQPQDDVPNPMIVWPTKARPLPTIWSEYCTDPFNADTDGDSVPDGWELYMLGGPKVGGGFLPRERGYGPLSANSALNPQAVDTGYADNYHGFQSTGFYWDCPTILNGNPHPFWTNKRRPTDPTVDDTDGDGIPDLAEQNLFAYGNPTSPGAGGGLDPLSWDTDGDGLPDPWEVQYGADGQFVTTGAATENTTTEVGEDGVTNTTTVVTAASGYWGKEDPLREGEFIPTVDGTVGDANADYDHDGLQNWQEYLVNAMRCWRYDDTISKWGNDESTEIPYPLTGENEDPNSEWSQYWAHHLLCDGKGGKFPAGQYPDYNPHIFVDKKYDIGAGWFSLCTNEWDSACGKWYMFYDGVYHDLSNPGTKFMDELETVVCNRFTWRMYNEGFVSDMDGTGDPPHPFYFGDWDAEPKNLVLAPKEYPGTDPTKADTDGDGMDDFYELFHGLNPLLAASGGYGAGGGVDRVFEAYGGGERWPNGALILYPSAEDNYWLNSYKPMRLPRSKHAGLTYDFAAYPWLTGLGYADPDGDNIRNQEEAIMPGVQASSTYHHSDPTPLWMTHKDYEQSFTYRYYKPEDLPETLIFPVPDGFTDEWGDYHYFNDYPWLHWEEIDGVPTLTVLPYKTNLADINVFGWSFEENEGYDTDHDYLSDFEEGQGKTKAASDPQHFDDPQRRQAMWFPGKDALLQTVPELGEVCVDDSVPTGIDLPFLYYTVECWAKAEGDLTRNQILVERAVLTAQANPADERFLRKNFQIGLHGGRWYTKFDSTGTDDSQPVEITDGPTVTTNWTHIAATFDGSYLRLYINGICVKEKASSVQPEHGVAMLLVTEPTIGDSTVNRLKGKLSYADYTTCVGASVSSDKGLNLSLSKFSSYDQYFNGYIDEVRIWDGARKPDEILTSYRERFTREKALALREDFFGAWALGYNRSPATIAELPAELKFHWAFDHIPGATESRWTLPSPAGFTTPEDCPDAKAIWSRPKDWKDPWWDNVNVKSTVYDDYAWVPWIACTVGHLPRYDKTTTDSFCWSDNFYGTYPASLLGYGVFNFPRTMEPWSRWHQVVFKGDAPPYTISDRYTSVVMGNDNLLTPYAFTMRHRLREGFDLLPLGGAYAKRISLAEGGMWDEAGAADPWAQTSSDKRPEPDSDNDGLPTWWEDYAKENYLGKNYKADVDWDTTIIYNGIGIPAWQAYIRDLANGLLPNGKFYDEYANTADNDHDGLPDWWEDYWKVRGDGFEDFDHDGLSNFQEWKTSEDEANGFGTVNGYPYLNPMRARSADGQEETDYFLKLTNTATYAGWYLGSVIADHDMMEDELEDLFGLDRTLYDAWSDKDEDGWTAWSELRYSTFKMSRVIQLVSHLIGEEEVMDSPVPVVRVTLRYNGTQLKSGASANVVVQAYQNNTLTKKPTAVFTIAPGKSTGSRYLYLGSYEERIVHGTFTPGFPSANLEKIRLQCATIQPNDRFTWTVGGAVEGGEDLEDIPIYTGTYEEMLSAYLADPENVQVQRMPFAWVDVVDPSDGEHIIPFVSMDEKTQKGYFLVRNKRVGEVDMLTGDFWFDLSVVGPYYMVDAGGTISEKQYVFRIAYESVTPAMQSKALTVSLANADQGALKEGTAAFVAFLDLNGDGVYTPAGESALDEPIGFVKDVEIGWDKVPELTIEMTDKSAAAGKRFAYGDDVGELRIIRTAFNGEETVNGEKVRRRIVYSREAKDVERKTVYEGDLVTNGKFGLDWAGLRSDLKEAKLDAKDVLSVSYLVVKDTASVDHIAEENILDRFTVEYAATQTKPTLVSPSDRDTPYVTETRPTFRWKGTDDNTAFMLQILDASAPEKVVYSNAVSALPARDTTGCYVWHAPVFIGTNVCGDAWALDNHRDYYWRVKMLNPKFSDPATAVWSDKVLFKTALADANDFTTACGTAKVQVRYYGPATNSLSNVVVRLYQTADFTGIPAAQTRLWSVDGAATNLVARGYQVTFKGLPSGDYYALAFIDRNGDNVRQRYESWGYANQIGMGVAAIYTPVALKVNAMNNDVPSAEIYMEDTDVNRDRIVDCLNLDESILKGAVETVTGGSGGGDTDRDGLTDDEEASDTYTKPQRWDTDGDQMPDGWEAKFADLDPLFADADTVVAGDVMAYAEVERTLVTAVVGGEDVTYILNPSNETVRVGDKIKMSRLMTWYEYPSLVGSGTNLVLVNNIGIGTNLQSSADFLVDRIEKKTAVIVHGQVYDEFGYSMKTAIPQDGSVNTKPFTALDKYLVVRYLQAIGFKGVDEEAMNANKWWSKYTLKPNDADNDRDGMADGWELYVMFGTNTTAWAARHSLSEAAISPWQSNDRQVDIDGDKLVNVDEYCDGNDPSNPWDKYSVYHALVEEGVIPEDTEKFDDRVRRFGIGKSEQTDDWDLDLVLNGQEMWAYYIDYANKSKLLADISPTNAWSNGETPDYFRTFAEEIGVTNYLGAYYNGAEFIEPTVRALFDMGDLVRAGTRDLFATGWDVWSIVRSSLKKMEDNGQGLMSEALNIAVKYTAMVYGGEGEGFDGGSEAALVEFHRTTCPVCSGTAEMVNSLDDVIMNHGGLERMREEIRARQASGFNVDGFEIPQPTINFTFKYAGQNQQNIIIEAYQVNSAYPERGEQMTASWSAQPAFDAGIGYYEAKMTGRGTLKQGPTRFVAYIDRDEDGQLSGGDVVGTAEAVIGYLGCDLTMRLGEGNPALPYITLTPDAAAEGAAEQVQNPIQTVAIVRTKVNGEYVNPRGVTLRCYDNNVNRTALYPSDFIDEDFIGLDPYLAQDPTDEVDPSEEELPNVETVTYEIVKLPRRLVTGDEEGQKITNTLLNHYTYVEEVEDDEGNVSNIYHTVDQNVNREFTLQYSITRDIPLEVKGEAASTLGNAIVSFTVPTDRAVTKFWLKISDGAGKEQKCYGENDRGFLLPNLAEGRVVLDGKWFEENNLTSYLTVTSHTVRVALGNDKFPEAPVDDDEWSAKATFGVAASASFEGQLLVKVLHPLDAIDLAVSNLTIAVYDRADLANPVAVTNRCAVNEVVAIDGLRENKPYYVAAWYVKDEGDGRANGKIRMPYDTWGYVTSLGAVTNGFDAAAVKALEEPVTTNMVYLQDTDWNDNGIIDRTELIMSNLGRTPSKSPDWDPLDVDGDGIPDEDDDDPVFDNSGDWLEGDVMAYELVTNLCVRIGTMADETNWVWYVVMNPTGEPTADRLSGEKIIIPRGTMASNLTSLATTYVYGKKKSSPLGLGTNITFAAGSPAKVYDYEWKTVAYVHHQVYAKNGFDPRTANALLGAGDGSVNTKKFTKLDKYIVTNYLAAVGAVAPTADWSGWVLRESTKKSKYNIDFDYDGIPDGWELYTMFGTNAVQTLTKTAKDDVINAWVADDRNQDPDKDLCTNLHEYDGGNEPTDPWNAYSMYENLAKKGLLLPGTVKFTDKVAKKFGLSAATLNNDDDLDLITNIDELKAYYLDQAQLKDLSATNAWSDGSTPDYFRVCGSKYLGELFNGGEFIEPMGRAAMGIEDLMKSGTRDYSAWGWDAWSVARYSILAAEGVASVAGVDEELALIVRYFNAILPGQFDGAEFGAVIDFFHATWPDVIRVFNPDGSYSDVTDVSLTGLNLTKDVIYANTVHTTKDLIAFFGGKERMQAEIAANRKEISAADILMPEPTIHLMLKYAGNDTKQVTVCAYQVNPAYPEHGVQMTAQWSAAADFNAGVAEVELATPATGSLKQGPARFVIFMDANGDLRFSPGETYGVAELEVGYLGARKEVLMGTASAAMPAFEFGDGSNAVSQIKIVRTHINGKPVLNPHTVYKRLFANNVERETIFPDDYVLMGEDKDGNKKTFIGVDRYLSSYGASVNSVTYEILEGPGPFTVSNLTEFATLSSNLVNTADGERWMYVTNTIPGLGGNKRYTVSYSPVRDIPNVITLANQLLDGDDLVSFTVPRDTPVTKFWVLFDNTIYPKGDTKIGGKVYTQKSGFLLPPLADNVATVHLRELLGSDAETLVANKDYKIRIALGNDKFPNCPDKTVTTSWSPEAVFALGDKTDFKGQIKVQVKHPTVAALNRLVVAAYETADLVNPVTTSAWHTLNSTVTLKGLVPNRNYYLAAWYVKQADGRRSAADRLPYDTWGYVTQLGISASGFDVAAVPASANPAVTNVIWLQDTDWNRNGKNDREESLKAIWGIYSPGGKNYGGVVDYLDDFDLDGLPDLYEEIVPVEPDEPDEPTIIGRDVMAYYEQPNMPFVALGTNGSDSADWVWCAVFDLASEGAGVKLTDGTIQLQTSADKLGTLYSTYSYYNKDIQEDRSRWNAIGTNVHYGADMKVQATRTGKAKFLHAQVYSLFGYNPKTAVPVDDAVHTKAFTAIDKYLVCRYLENIGVSGVDETMMSTNVAYQWIWSLTDGVIDQDRDGMADGWELYVMFGPTGMKLPTGVALDENAILTNAVAAKILSPFDTADGQATAPGVHARLKAIEEYDNGHAPTDPWTVDSDHDNVSDYYAYTYMLKGEDARKDSDGDGLSNYAEYLITEIFQLAAVDPHKTHTSDGIHDYFRKVGEFYLGELFMDHDRMEDAIEDLFPGMNRYVYDAHLDADGDGWSNWSEVHAYALAGTTNVMVSVTNGTAVTTREEERSLYAERPQPKIQATVTYYGSRLPAQKAASAVFKFYSDGPSMQHCDAVYMVSNIVRGINRVTLDEPVSGYVKEGRNWVAAYLLTGDAAEDNASGDDNGTERTAPEFANDMPFGFAGNVEIGWAQPAFALDLTDESAVFDRIDLYAGTSSRQIENGEPEVAEETARDRWVVDAPSVEWNKERVRIIPYAIRGTLQAKGQNPLLVDQDVDLISNGVAQLRVAADFYVDRFNHSMLSEADFIDELNGRLDLDWDGWKSGYFKTTKVIDAVEDLTLVKYRVILGEGSYLGPLSNLDYAQSNLQARVFSFPIERWFESTASRTTPTIVSPNGGVVYAAQPTFKWRLDEPMTATHNYGCSYTAFQIIIMTTNGTQKIYDSGLQRAPAQDANGCFTWTAPISVGGPLPQGGIFAPGEYRWQVQMYNAKFQAPVKKHWAIGNFAMATGLQQEMDDHGYSSIDVAVKYAGPATVLADAADLTKTTGTVRVQAYLSPDFTGAPLAEAMVTNVTKMTDLVDALPNVRLVGLPRDATCYLLAFIDTNGNGIRDVWESWGYATESVSLTSRVTAPVIGVWIEDSDTDQDWLPDAWEYVRNGGDLTKESATVDPEGKIVFRTETYLDVKDGEAGISTGLGGASLTIFQNMAIVQALLGKDVPTTKSTIDLIREAVEKKIDESTFKVTSLTFDQLNRKVILTVDAEVYESVAGQLLTRLYTIESPATATVKVHVYQKDTLATAKWTEVSGSPFTKEIGAGEPTVEVPLGDVDCTSGFYKVEVEQ